MQRGGSKAISPARPLSATAFSLPAGTFAVGHLGHVEGEVQQGEDR